MEHGMGIELAHQRVVDAFDRRTRGVEAARAVVSSPPALNEERRMAANGAGGRADSCSLPQPAPRTNAARRATH